MAEGVIGVYPHGDRVELITAAEFKAKYGKRHFTSHTAPKAVLYSYLYDVYQQNEGGVKETLYPDIVTIQKKVETYEDMDAWNGYLNLAEWQRSAFNTAVFMRNSVQSALSDLNNIVRNLIAAENLYNELKRSSISQDAALWMYTLSLEAYTPQSNGTILSTLRKNIEAGTRYMIAYNTFMELIAETIKAPEYVIMEVYTGGLWESIATVNEALSVFRETVRETRAEEAEGKAPGIITQWTPEFFRETMKAFEPIGEDIPPVPEEKQQEARARIKQGVSKGQFSWYGLYHSFSFDYWRMKLYGF